MFKIKVEKAREIIKDILHIREETKLLFVYIINTLKKNNKSISKSNIEKILNDAKKNPEKYKNLIKKPEHKEMFTDGLLNKNSIILILKEFEKHGKKEEKKLYIQVTLEEMIPNLPPVIIDENTDPEEVIENLIIDELEGIPEKNDEKDTSAQNELVFIEEELDDTIETLLENDFQNLGDEEEPTELTDEDEVDLFDASINNEQEDLPEEEEETPVPLSEMYNEQEDLSEEEEEVPVPLSEMYDEKEDETEEDFTTLGEMYDEGNEEDLPKEESSADEETDEKSDIEELDNIEKEALEKMEEKLNAEEEANDEQEEIEIQPLAISAPVVSKVVEEETEKEEETEEEVTEVEEDPISNPTLRYINNELSGTYNTEYYEEEDILECEKNNKLFDIKAFDKNFNPSYANENLDDNEVLKVQIQKEEKEEIVFEDIIKTSVDAIFDNIMNNYDMEDIKDFTFNLTHQKNEFFIVAYNYLLETDCEYCDGSENKKYIDFISNRKALKTEYDDIIKKMNEKDNQELGHLLAINSGVTR